MDADSKIVASETKSFIAEASKNSSIEFSSTLANVKHWNAEHPNLYTVLIETKDKNGNTLEVTISKIGFRSVEIKNGQFKVNGQYVYFKGVNLHEHQDRTGHYLDEATMIKDIKTMKMHNINAVRTSHYPQPERFYELCNQYGLYIVDEGM